MFVFFLSIKGHRTALSTLTFSLTDTNCSKIFHGMSLNYSTSPIYLSVNQLMASKFTANGLRLLRCYSKHRLSLSLRPGPAPFLGFRNGASELRFLSSSVTENGKPVEPVKAKQSGLGEGDGDYGGEGSGGNGSTGEKIGNVAGGGARGRILVAELHKEATESYMAYAMSVLLGRALPDVRDGLKPVHRRIL